jgi:hypothetical protein
MTNPAEAYPTRAYTADVTDGFKHPTDDFNQMRAFLELRFIDPLTFNCVELQRWHRTMIELAVTEQREEPSFEQAMDVSEDIQALEGLEQATNLWGLNLQYGRVPGVLLEETLNRFDSLVPKVRELHSCFENLAVTAGLEPTVYEPMLTAARNALAELLRRRGLVTPQHLALQAHLEHFINFAMPPIASKSLHTAEVLYGPLFALRDEYFDAPKPGVLRTYLATVTLIEPTPEFERLVEVNRISRSRFRSTIAAGRLDEADLRLPDCEALLEIYTMLEE